MKKASFLLSVFIAQGLINLSYANTSVQVVTVETDAYLGTEYMTLNRDDSGSIVSLVYRFFDNTTVSYTLDQLRGEPQLLKTFEGHDVTYISVESDFTAEAGGHVNVRYLSNGITDSYKNFRVFMSVNASQIVLKSDPNTEDADSDKNTFTGEFNHLFMKKATILGQMVGIAKVVPSQE